MKKIVDLVIAIAFVCLVSPGNAQEIVTDEILASADIANGKRTYLRCRACHTLAEGERHKVGPNLWGLFGSEVGTQEEFNYSQALQDADFIWTPDKLNEWLTKPKDFLPDNKMAFVGLNREQDRINLIAYLIQETQAAESTEGDNSDTSEDASDQGESAEQ